MALLAGAVAIGARKGGPIHSRAGLLFVGAMLLLGLTATLLDLVSGQPAAALGGIVPCYFAATAWATARRRDRTAGRFELFACVVALALGAAMGAFAWTAKEAPTPVGTGPVFALAGVCLFAGLLDLSAILRSRLSRAQRISRHLWRMSFALFVATGSFFLGQQDVLPAPLRGSPVLYALAFAPFAAMIYGLAWVRMGRRLAAPQRSQSVGAGA